jgi:gluconolactonase
MENGSVISRGKFMGAVGVVASTTALAPIVRAQAPPAGKPADPASTVTTPPRDFGPNASPITYVDPDVITIDPLLNSYRQGNTPIKRQSRFAPS